MRQNGYTGEEPQEPARPAQRTGRYGVMLALLLCLCLASGMPSAQTSPPAVTPTQEAGGPIRLDTVAARRETLQKRLDTLEQLLLSPEEAEVVRSTLDQQVKMLTALETALQKRQNYLAQLESLPRQVNVLNAERLKLASQEPRRFPEATEKLRLDYETQLQSTRTELEGLRNDLTAGELRLSSIAREIEQHTANRAQLEKDLLAARSDVARAPEQKSVLGARVELLDLRQQLQQGEIEMLEAEREWLSKRGPLRDAQLGLAQTRYAVLQQELELLKAALGKAISQESTSLSGAEENLERQLQKSTDPAESMLLHIRLETVRLRRRITEYRQQTNRLSDQTRAQEQRNTNEKQEAAYLVGLVEKYGSGERIAQRLQAAFTRLRQAQAELQLEATTRAMEVDLQALTGQELELEEQLYAFDRQTEARLRHVLSAMAMMAIGQREAEIARLHKALDEQKATLRECKQTLTALVQEQTKWLTLRRDYRRILEEADQFVLTKLFWLRDGQTIGLRTLRDAVGGIQVTGQRLQAQWHSMVQALPRQQSEAIRFWAVLVVGLLGVPWLLRRLGQRWRHHIATLLTAERAQEAIGTRSRVALLVGLYAARWPVYVSLLAWAWPRVMLPVQNPSVRELPLAAGLQFAALVLWCWSFGRASLRSGGWMSRYWGIRPAVGSALQRTLAAACLATLVFLVPRALLLHAPGGPEAVAGSLALARLCFTAYQAALIGLVAVMSRRGSALMTVILARSREADGRTWRFWPLGYVCLLAAMGTALALDVLGFHYTSRTLWLRSGEALLLVLILVWLDHIITTVIRRGLARQATAAAPGSSLFVANLWALSQTARPLIRMGLGVLTLLAIERIYGLSTGLTQLLDQVHLLEVGHTREGQPLWLTLADITKALLVLVGVGFLHFASLCEAVLFPHVRWDAGLRYTFVTLSRYGLLFLALWWSLSTLHMNWSSIQWIVAAVSVGVGFGLQEIVGNFVSGLILLLERPIRVDDVVTVSEQTGVVKRITIRATAIQNVDNQTVIIPNKEFIAQKVTNWTLGDTHVRLVLPVGVAYGSDLALVQRLLLETVQAHPSVLHEPAPAIFLRSLGDHALQWEIWCFVPSPAERLRTAHDLLMQIEQAFRQHHITIPFPQQDVHVRSVDAALILQSTGNGHST